MGAGLSRGIALITTLIMMAVLSLMTIVFVTRMRAQGFFGVQSQTSLGALNAAEAGVADVMSLMTATPAYATNLVNQPLPSGGATYTVLFGPANSVNNLTGGAPVAGPRGPVQPGTAFLMVEGQQGLTHRTVEVIVSRQGSVVPDATMVSSGVVRLRGNVKIDGVQGSTDPTPVDAIVRSNSTANAAGQVSWTGGPGESASIQGSVYSASANGSAIQLGGASVTGQVQNNQPSTPPPVVDITSRITAKSSAPAPTMTAGVTTLAAGDYYVSGDLSYTGDLDLQGANLYVSGKLDVVGTIKGSGSVFVGKDTSFYGDSEITASNAQQVSLYSKGSVSLHGFDGTAYMDGLVVGAGNDTNGIPYSTHWANAKSWTQTAQNYLTSASPSAYGFQGSDFDYTVDMLAATGTASVTPPFPVPLVERAPIPKLNLMLQSQPPGPSRDFMIKKLTFLIDPADQTIGLYARHVSMLDAQTDVNNTLSSGVTDGLADGSNDSFTTFGPLLQPMIKNLLSNTMNQLDYDKLGSSYFNGLIYTNGYFYSDNEVNVRGSLMAVDDSSQSAGYPDPANPGLQVNPGDIYLNRGVRVTYVRDLLGQSGSTIGTLGIKVWMSR